MGVNGCLLVLSRTYSATRSRYVTATPRASWSSRSPVQLIARARSTLVARRHLRGLKLQEVLRHLVVRVDDDRQIECQAALDVARADKPGATWGPADLAGLA